MSYHQIFDDRRFDEELEILNALCPGWKWEWTTARKRHEDEFGDTIEEGDAYLAKQNSQNWSDIVRLSRKSMEILLYLVTNGNRLVHHIANNLLEPERRRQEEMMELLSKSQKFPGSQDDESESD